MKPSVTLHERNGDMAFCHVDSAVSGYGINSSGLADGFWKWVKC